MLQWISENVGTILICMGLIVIVALIVRSLIRQKKQGKSSCSQQSHRCKAPWIQSHHNIYAILRKQLVAKDNCHRSCCHPDNKI